MRTEGQKQSQRQEKRLAKTLGGSVNAASGALPWRKADVRTDQFLIEAKWTSKASYSLKSSTLEEVMTEAAIQSRIGLMVIDIEGKSYVVLGEDDFVALVEGSDATP